MVSVPLVSMASWPLDVAVTLPPAMVMLPLLLMALGCALLLLAVKVPPVVVAVMSPPVIVSVPSALMHLPPVPVLFSVSVPPLMVMLLSDFRQPLPFESLSV